MSKLALKNAFTAVHLALVFQKSQSATRPWSECLCIHACECVSLCMCIKNCMCMLMYTWMCIWICVVCRAFQKAAGGWLLECHSVCSQPACSWTATYAGQGLHCSKHTSAHNLCSLLQCHIHMHLMHESVHVLLRIASLYMIRQAGRCISSNQAGLWLFQWSPVKAFLPACLSCRGWQCSESNLAALTTADYSSAPHIHSLSGQNVSALSFSAMLS